jgi:hypothetical protein
MTSFRSDIFEAIRARVSESYGPTPISGEVESERLWRRTTGGRWRNRVGIPRLTAQEVAYEASALLRSINLSVFKNDPRAADQLHHARAAVAELAQIVGAENWKRFKDSVVDPEVTQ